jgi:hypothetical protein
MQAQTSYDRFARQSPVQRGRPGLKRAFPRRLPASKRFTKIFAPSKDEEEQGGGQ